MIGPCRFNCTNQTNDGYCKTTVCIHPIYSQRNNVVVMQNSTEATYSISLEEIRQMVRNVCDKIYLDESTSNFMYTKFLKLIQTEIISRCNLIK